MKVNRKKMLQNIQLTNGLVYAGLAKDILSKKIPSDEAKSIVDEACSRTDENINLADALAGLTEEHNIDWHNELYPEACFGSSKEIIRLAVTDIKNFINQ